MIKENEVVTAAFDPFECFGTRCNGIRVDIKALKEPVNNLKVDNIVIDNKHSGLGRTEGVGRRSTVVVAFKYPGDTERVYGFGDKRNIRHVVVAFSR